MRFLFVFILMIIGLPGAFARQKIQYDSSSIHAREFSQKNLSDYKKEREFQYESIHEPPKSLWQRFVQWFWSKIDSILGSKAGNLIFNWALIVIAVVIIIYFIIKVTGMGGTGLFGKKNSNSLSYITSNEDIHSINFDEAIQQAIDDKNFRLAVRLLYLQSLKTLTDKGKINWQLNKTNHDYLVELNETPHQPEFIYLTRQFENNWYGNLPVAEPEFKLLQQSFSNFNHQLN
jgi:hypothetical protein